MEVVNKADAAYQILKDKILTLELEPGEPLKEVHLSEVLNISRTPIREAMRKLISEGFVEETGKNVNSVTRISLGKFIEIYQVREALENLSVKLATLSWADTSEIDELRQIVKGQMTIADKKKVEVKEFLHADLQFHVKLLEMSRNDLLIQSLKNILDLYYRYNYYSIFHNRAVLTTMEHDEIIDAIEARNSKKAQALMKSHLAIIREAIMIGLAGVKR